MKLLYTTMLFYEICILQKRTIRMSTTRPYTTVFFDLDGTLLPLDTSEFMKTYTASLGAYAHDNGMDAQATMDALFKGVMAMAENDGSRSNHDLFWETFSRVAGVDAQQTEPLFDEYYRTRFDEVARVATPSPESARAIAALKERGYTLAITTMPMFPLEAVHARIRWAGLDPDDFLFVTDYATAHSIKPKPAYYEEALRRAGVDASEVLMVGNHTREDGGAYRVGTDIYFVTDHVIESDEGLNLEDHKHGTLAEFADFCEALPYLR